jgi:hypothetical protein
MSNPETANFVSVGCKLPHGIHLDLKNKNGEGPRHTLQGANASRIIGGFGITENIPGDFMAQWLRQNAKHPAVINGAIFIHSNRESAEVMAKERAKDVVTGFEAIDPVKTGMLKGPNGENDPLAVAKYNQARAENPDRSRQRME